MRRALRIVGTLLIAAGLLIGAWVVVVWRWQDPFTAFVTWRAQTHLSQELNREFVAYPAAPRRTENSAAAMRRLVAFDARAFQRHATPGQAIGRITVPRMGIRMVLVYGTDHESLKKGPGLDARTHMPGEGQLAYIAGHRTTYLAPFSHIDQMRKGDRVTIQMPYATFVYRVTGHRIVDAADLAVLRSHGHEELELQACHPRFFATNRYIVFAKPVSVVLR
jgi:sortase A